MPEPTTWFEIVGYYKASIKKRLVSTETACYVFHPNGRKSLKKSEGSWGKPGSGGVDWWKSFDEAKTELKRRKGQRILALQRDLAQEFAEMDEIEKLTEESCQSKG